MGSSRPFAEVGFSIHVEKNVNGQDMTSKLSGRKRVRLEISASLKKHLGS